VSETCPGPQRLLTDAYVHLEDGCFVFTNHSSWQSYKDSTGGARLNHSVLLVWDEKIKCWTPEVQP
jgi:hypothetical protein